MIKSKRKSIIFAKKISKATYKIDSNHIWDHAGESQKLGQKYKSNSNFVNSLDYIVAKSNSTGLDLPDA